MEVASRAGPGCIKCLPAEDVPGSARRRRPGKAPGTWAKVCQECKPPAAARPADGPLLRAARDLSRRTSQSSLSALPVLGLLIERFILSYCPA